MDLNQVILIGRLAAEPETKVLTNGNDMKSTCCNFKVAVNTSYRTKNGEDRNEVAFIPCEVWDKSAEILSEYGSKGREVLIRGRLRIDAWKDKTTGEPRNKMKVRVERFDFLGPNPGRTNEPIGTTAVDDTIAPEVSAAEIPF